MSPESRLAQFVERDLGWGEVWGAFALVLWPVTVPHSGKWVGMALAVTFGCFQLGAVAWGKLGLRAIAAFTSSVFFLFVASRNAMIDVPNAAMFAFGFGNLYVMWRLWRPWLRTMVRPRVGRGEGHGE